MSKTEAAALRAAKKASEKAELAATKARIEVAFTCYLGSSWTNVKLPYSGT